MIVSLSELLASLFVLVFIFYFLFFRYMWLIFLKSLLRFRANRELYPTQPLTPSTIGWAKELKRQINLKNLMGWDKENLLGKAKSACTSKTKQNNKLIHYFPSAGRYSALSRKAELFTHNGYLERQCHNAKHTFFFSSSQFHCYAWCHMIWNITLPSLSQLSWFCPLAATWHTPSYSQAE